MELALWTACFASAERKKKYKNSRTEKDVLASYTIFLIYNLDLFLLKHANVFNYKLATFDHFRLTDKPFSPSKN